MAKDPVASLENKIKYRTQRLKEQREAVAAWSEKKIAAADSDAKREFWRNRAQASYEQINEREKAWLGPLQEELAQLMQNLLDE
jgi:hypothetical protein